MTGTYRRKALAKINLVLEVVARRPDGYHQIRSIFATTPRLADTITLDLGPGMHGFTVQSGSAAIPHDATNLCVRAAARYLEVSKGRAGGHITIDKRIPVAAGLGGGSSDAAAVLLALNERFGRRLDAAQLADVGAGIGRDLPFFLSGAPLAHVTGAGEMVTPLPHACEWPLLIVNPGIEVSTAEAFRELSSALWFMERDERRDRTRAMQDALAAGDVARVAASLYNDFELTIVRRHPVIKEVKQALLAFGAAGALMSGSGPTVFGLFDSTEMLARAHVALMGQFPTFVVVEG